MNSLMVPIVEDALDVLKIRRSFIFPFTEHPDEERSTPGESEKKMINATDLFSLFTANIIREKVIFTR